MLSKNQRVDAKQGGGREAGEVGDKIVANLFAVLWNCTRLFFFPEAPDKQVRSKCCGQRRLSSDLSGDER